MGYIYKEENGEEFKIEQANIIQNTPKMLLILLTKRLRNEAKYTLSLRTQYAKMGSTCTTRMLREASSSFVWNGEKKEQELCENKDCSNTSTLCKTSENSTKELLASSLKESESKGSASKATGHKKRGNKRIKAKQFKLKSAALVA